MNRIENLFQTKQQNILSIYYPAGYPNLQDTVPILRELEQAGVDMVEIGIPFSDPMADGPVIQDASTRALRNGISLRLIFEQLEEVRHEGIRMPILLMGYLNPIMQYGFERFCQSCTKVGVDGVIIPDLPFADYVKEAVITGFADGFKIFAAGHFGMSNYHAEKPQGIKHCTLVMILLLLAAYTRHLTNPINLSLPHVSHHTQR